MRSAAIDLGSIFRCEIVISYELLNTDEFRKKRKEKLQSMYPSSDILVLDWQIVGIVQIFSRKMDVVILYNKKEHEDIYFCFFDMPMNENHKCGCLNLGKSEKIKSVIEIIVSCHVLLDKESNVVDDFKIVLNETTLNNDSILFDSLQTNSSAIFKNPDVFIISVWHSAPCIVDIKINIDYAAEFICHLQAKITDSVETVINKLKNEICKRKRWRAAILLSAEKPVIPLDCMKIHLILPDKTIAKENVLLGNIKWTEHAGYHRRNMRPVFSYAFDDDFIKYNVNPLMFDAFVGESDSFLIRVANVKETVRKVNNKRIFCVHPNMTVLQLKQVIGNIFDIPPEGQKLSKKSEALINDTIITTLNLSQLDVLKLEEVSIVQVIFDIEDMKNETQKIKESFYIESAVRLLKNYLISKLKISEESVEVYYKDQLLLDDQLLCEFPCSIDLHLLVKIRRNKITIKIKGIGVPKSYYVIADTTEIKIADIAAIAAAKLRIPKHMQNIIWRGISLNPESTFYSLGILSGDILHICQKGFDLTICGYWTRIIEVNWPNSIANIRFGNIYDGIIALGK